MKKSLVALALFGAFASVAQAQSSVVIYGALDAGFSHTSVSTGAAPQNKIGAIGDNNKLGFKGVEDLGNGLKALFQLEMRFLSDTGTNEGTAAAPRPLFQGESRVGLQGAFGTVRLGRGKTAFVDSSAAFEPWSGAGNSGAGFQSVITVAGFNSDPLNGVTTANSQNRISNAAFYNTPVFSGFQANASVGTKEDGITTDALVATAVPFSTSATYNQGIVGAMLAYERNATDDKVWSVAGSVTPITALKLMASYTRQNAEPTGATGDDQKAWLLGANYTMGAGKFLAGYGQLKADDVDAKIKKASVGYQYSLSKRTYVFADIANTRLTGNDVVNTSTKYYGAGVHHNF
jgi:predicted porin